MSYTAIRDALQTWFTDANIEGMQKIYKDMPWFIEAAQWNIAAPVAADPENDIEAVPARTWACVGFIHLDHSEESRITVPAYTGHKEVNYVVSLGLQYQHMIETMLTGDDTEADQWVIGLDKLIDAVKARIRSDATQGTGENGVIFQAGQDNGDIRVDSDFPVYDNTRVYSFHRVQFNVTEIITA